MDEVNIVFLAVGRCVDACCVLFDLLVRTISWMIRFMSGVGASIHNTVVVLSESSLVEYWNFALFSFLTASEAVSSAACGLVHVVEGWLQALGGVFESFKMVGHLSCHVAWRVKDLLHRGLMSGSCILRQTCEGLCIALSLVLYFVNTVVNLVLISTQNCLSVLAGVWEVVADPVHKLLELALTLLTFLYSCLVGASVLLWTPCQLLLDLLGALGHVFLTVVMMESQGMLLAVVIIISLALLSLCSRLPVLVRRLSLHPGARGEQTVVEQAQPNRELQEVSPNTEASISDTELPSANEPRQSDAPVPQQDGEVASGSSTNTADVGVGRGGFPTDGELLSLLKEQEERKKCVICQDVSKTVLLLPCRHLCLCRPCADILTQHRHSQQRCCPLCREPITHTMDVFL